MICVETSENKGYALCSAIRRAPLGDVKIALISAKASEEEYARHRGTKGRADLYLHKPIPSPALISALADLIPLKEADPDNPLGDLAGADLGDEWLESLKTELEVETPEMVLPEPARASNTGFLPPLPKVVPLPPRNGETPDRGPQRTEGEFELLEWRVKDLELKLGAQNEELARKTREIEDLIQRSAAITRNLDAAEQSLNEMDLLRGRIQELDGQAAQARAELEGALEERRGMEDRIEELNVLLAEKTQQATEMLESHQLLQAQLEEAWEAGDKAKGLEASLAGAQASLAEAQASVAALEARAGQAEEDAGRHAQERDAARSESEGRQGRIQELQAELDTAREQVSFQDLTIRNLAEERRTLQAERDRQEEVLAEQNGEMLLLKQKLARLEEAAEERDRLREELDRLGLELAGKDERLKDLEQAHEAQRSELLSGIEEREARLGALAADLESHRDRAGRLDLDRQALEGRLQALTPLLEDLEGKVRQALDHARS